MAAEGKEGQSVPVTGIMVALFVAAGFVVQQFALESSRPAPSESRGGQVHGVQDVDARLWQDPLAAVSAYRENELARHLRVEQLRSYLKRPRSQPTKSRATPPDDEHEIGALANSIALTLCSPEDKDTIRLLPVLVPGAPFEEDAELRRRTRYAVISALVSLSILPDDPDSIGYAYVPDAWRIPSPEFIPYEWFYQPVSETRQGKAWTLVLWLDEGAFYYEPLAALRALVRMLTPKCKVAPSRELGTVNVLGPVTTLVWRQLAIDLDNEDKAQALSGRKEQAKALSGRQEKTTSLSVRKAAPELLILSGSATGPLFAPQETAQTRGDKVDSDPRFARCTASGSVCMRRVIGVNSTLVEKLLGELKERRLDPGSKIPFSKRRNTLVVISEQDTSFGRNLGGEFARQAGANNKWVLPYSYLRGIDGQGPISGATVRPPAPRPEPQPSQKREPPPAPRSHGQHQIDYVARLVADLEYVREHDKEIEIAAIAIMGNDIYDKLLIVRALKPAFPKAVFLTTDLDARMLDAEEAKWTRNLVVASSYGLSLHPDLQRSALLFRDSYQTANYFATLLMFGSGPACIGQIFEDGLPWLHAPLLFEVGRSHLAPLRTDSSARIDACYNGKAQMLHPDFRMPEPPSGESLLYLVAAILLIWAGWRFMQLPATTDVRQELALELGLLAAIRTYFILFGLACSIPASQLVGFFALVSWPRDAPPWPAFLLATGMAVCVFAWLVVEIKSAVRRGRERAIRVACGAFVLGLGLGAPVRAVAQIWLQSAEPFAWAQGISVWPTQMLRGIACLMAIRLLYSMYRMLARNSREIERAFQLGYVEPAFEWRALWSELRSWLLTLAASLRTKCRAVFTAKSGPSPDPAVDQATVNPKMDEVWQAYRSASRSVWRATRVLLISASFVGISMLVTSLTDNVPNVPLRGEDNFHHVLTLLLCTVILAIGLLTAVMDVTMLSVRMLVQRLRNDGVEFPSDTLEKLRSSKGFHDAIPASFATQYFIIDLVAQRTEVITRFIYYPFWVFALLVVARSPLVDNWHAPPGLLVIFGLAFLVVGACVISLREATLQLHTRALHEMNAALVQAHCAARDTEATLAQMERLYQQAAGESRGAFKSIAFQPIVKGLLVPLGSFSGVEILNFFLTRY